MLALGENLPRVWHAETTTARDRKELLRAVLEEVVWHAPRNEPRARTRLVWRVDHQRLLLLQTSLERCKYLCEASG